MGEAMVIDEVSKSGGVKRKREKVKIEMLTVEGRENRLKSLNEEIESLFRYFEELLRVELGLESRLESVLSSNGLNMNVVIAMLIEEKSWSYSKLVSEVFERVKEKENGVTIASVKSSVLFVGQRMAYGVPKADADVLEDETRSCLWCWEARDMKLLPKSLHGALKVRRTCRKKINERISAISELMSCLQKSEDHPTYKHDLIKASKKLDKVLAEADIRLLVENLLQKNDSEMAEKDTKNQATLIKELEKKKREEEKEKKRMDRELQKEKLQSEKEKKRMQKEAEKDEKRREKEESELRKQLKRKQEEIEREQRQKEKEAAEVKKNLIVQKQASLMERFLKKSKTSETSQTDPSPNADKSDSNPNRNKCILESVSHMMDFTLQKDEFDTEEIWRSHMNSWRLLGHSIRSNNKQHWGIRRKPKTAVIKELKLTTNKGPANEDELCMDSLIDGWEQNHADDKSHHSDTSAAAFFISKCLRRKQLLQFDKSNRPAFYGIWPKKSDIVGPRHPLKKDPDLEYDIDSDEEWEEEDPGESLSDSEKDEEETLDEGSLKGESEEENEDGFFVPDGYLSENEGVENDRKHSIEEDVINTTASSKPESENEEASAWIRQQKYLYNLTEHALKKNQPLIIVNLNHEKTQLSLEDLTGTLKAEQICLQALRKQSFLGGLCIEVPCDDSLQEENQDVCPPSSRVSPLAAMMIPDTDLPKIVSIIHSCSQGMNRVVESLLQAFPDIPKTHLRSKVREISDFVDNRWKVKKEILDKLGMSKTPEKSRGRTKTIAAFFSKRCLPPTSQGNPCESSPESFKPGSSTQPQHQHQECTVNMQATLF